MYDQTLSHTPDKIMAKLVPVQNDLKVDLQCKGQGHS